MNITLNLALPAFPAESVSMTPAASAADSIHTTGDTMATLTFHQIKTSMARVAKTFVEVESLTDELNAVSARDAARKLTERNGAHDNLMRYCDEVLEQAARYDAEKRVVPIKAMVRLASAILHYYECIHKLRTQELDGHEANLLKLAIVQDRESLLFRCRNIAAMAAADWLADWIDLGRLCYSLSKDLRRLANDLDHNRCSMDEAREKLLGMSDFLGGVGEIAGAAQDIHLPRGLEGGAA